MIASKRNEYLDSEIVAVWRGDVYLPPYPPVYQFSIELRQGKAHKNHKLMGLYVKSQDHKQTSRLIKIFDVECGEAIEIAVLMSLLRQVDTSEEFKDGHINGTRRTGNCRRVL